MGKVLSKGIFITFEGPEGCGKSTQSARLSEALREEGFDVLHTFEPGDTPLGRGLREMILEKKEVQLSKEAELLLFEADRAQHVRTTIKPALENRAIVICDRFNTATFAYQGYGLGLDMDKIRHVDVLATGGISPDLVILLDVDPAEGLKRACPEGDMDKMESRDLAFHMKVRQGYLDMAAKAPDKMKVVDALKSVDEVYSEIEREVYEFVRGHIRTE